MCFTFPYYYYFLEWVTGVRPDFLGMYGIVSRLWCFRAEVREGSAPHVGIQPCYVH